MQKATNPLTVSLEKNKLKVLTVQFKKVVFNYSFLRNTFYLMFSYFTTIALSVNCS